jgi:cell wall-associated NlpC family hydrolase
MSLSRSVLPLLGAGLLAASGTAGAQAPLAESSPAESHPATPRGEDIVRSARQYIGVRYVLGGSSPRAFDCSGFVRWVFAEHGIDLPRTAREQAGLGDAPYPGDLKPGDLLFFYGGNGAQHIAMYVGGDTIIHASSSRGRVTLDRFSGSPMRPTWFGRRLIAVRRIIREDVPLEVATTRPEPERARWSTKVPMRPWQPRR